MPGITKLPSRRSGNIPLFFLIIIAGLLGTIAYNTWVFETNKGKVMGSFLNLPTGASSVKTIPPKTTTGKRDLFPVPANFKSKTVLSRFSPTKSTNKNGKTPEIPKKRSGAPLFPDFSRFAAAGGNRQSIQNLGMNPDYTLMSQYYSPSDPNLQMETVVPCTYIKETTTISSDSQVGCVDKATATPNANYDQITIYRADDFAAFIRQNPGKYYTIFNEPNWSAQWYNYDDSTSNNRWNLGHEQYAKIHKRYYSFIHAIDPTAKFLSPALVQEVPGCSGTDECAVANYVINYMSDYKRLYGEEIPIDVWLIHTYDLDEKNWSWNFTIPNHPTKEVQSVADLKLAEDVTKKAVTKEVSFYKGIKNLPVWDTEWGLITQCTYVWGDIPNSNPVKQDWGCAPSTPLRIDDYVLRYTYDMTNWFPQNGVDKFFIFLTPFQNVGACWENRYVVGYNPASPCFSVWLYDSNNATKLGMLYSDLANGKDWNCPTNPLMGLPCRQTPNYVCLYLDKPKDAKDFSGQTYCN